MTDHLPNPFMSYPACPKVVAPSRPAERHELGLLAAFGECGDDTPSRTAKASKRKAKKAKR